MNDGDTLNDNDENAKVDARFLELLTHYYTIAMLESFIARADEGMRVKPDGQLARWHKTLAWLKQTELEQEQQSAPVTAQRRAEVYEHGG